MDIWNPILAEQHVKPVPFWQLCVAFVIGVVLLLASMWGTVVAIFSLVRS